MNLRFNKDWQLSESLVTPEKEYRSRTRRDFIKTLGFGAAGALLLPNQSSAATEGFPSKLNPNYSGKELKVTPFNYVTSYNNFYEFGMDKGDPVTNSNQGWKTDPWTVEIRGLARNTGKFDVNALVRKVGGIEQRVYRHRCVEAWSMVIPWDGFQLSKLIALAEPTADAKYITFTSFEDSKNAVGQQDSNFGWPYIEGLRLDEAQNELAFMATGVFGKPLPNQDGAPLRLVTPWKYGFKGAKSIVLIEFTQEAPLNTWQRIRSEEYGFYANVNPKVDHPRWSQGSERVIGGGVFNGRQSTFMFNGYERQVASLYKGMDLKRYY